MTPFSSVVRQPAFFVLLTGVLFTLVCLPFVLLDAPVDLFARGLFEYFFWVWGATIALLLLVANRLGGDEPRDQAPDDAGDGRA